MNKVESSDDIGDEFYEIYSCEKCNQKTLPTLTLSIAERVHASAGTFIVRKHKVTKEETRRSVVCVQCMKKIPGGKEKEMFCNEDEEPFMQWAGPNDD